MNSSLPSKAGHPVLTVDKAGSPADWQAIRRICALTGNAGDPVAADRCEIFAELWIAPYENLAAEWAWVVRDTVDGVVAGYLVAVPDTRTFRRRKLITCDLPLLVRLLTGRRAASEDADTFVRRFFRLKSDPERAFAPSVRRQIVRAFPAHLHVNLLPYARRRGCGAQLIDALVRDLAAQGICGVHCICGEGPAPFYQGQGFRRVAEAVFGSGIHLSVMGRQTAPLVSPLNPTPPPPPDPRTAGGALRRRPHT